MQEKNKNYKKSALRFALFLAAVLAFTAPFAESAFALSKGDAVQNFTLKSLDGKNVSLFEHKGKTVVLNFWATWCPPCRAEMPEMERLNKEFNETGGAVLLAVNLTDGRRETERKARNFIEENGYKTTVLLDEGTKVADYFGIRYIPTTFVIDKDGKLSGVIQGATTALAVKELAKEAEE